LQSSNVGEPLFDALSTVTINPEDAPEAFLIS
jgi:hypothetical protein